MLGERGDRGGDLGLEAVPECRSLGVEGGIVTRQEGISGNAGGLLWGSGNGRGSQIRG